MKVIISGGGTGGHLYPALAIGREFAKLGADILYIGSEYGIEKTIMPNQEFSYKLLPVKGFGSKNPLVLLKNADLVRKSYAMAKKIVAEYQPDLIVGTGGYASFPVMRAGAACGVKTLLHEANAEMGKANLKLAAVTDCLCLTYADTARQVKNAKNIVVTGMPVRSAIVNATEEQGTEYIGIDENTLLVTVTGGSQGAHHINMAMAEYYKTFASDRKILFYHIVGKLNKGDLPMMDYPFVKAKEYEEKMDLVLARTDICIGRAGASFLAEIAVRGIPSILVPYPYSGGHQEKNAAYYDRCGAARMVLDGHMADELPTALETLIYDADARRKLGARMKEEAKADALDRIVAAGLELIKEK